LCWEKNYPEVLFWIRATLAFALVRATELCIRGTRTKWCCLGFEDGAIIGNLIVCVISYFYCCVCVSLCVYVFHIIIIIIPGDSWLSQKSVERRDRYRDLSVVVGRLWNTSTSVVPMIVGALGFNSH